MRIEYIKSPSPKDALCHVLLKMAQMFWRFLHCIFAFSWQSPVGKVCALYLNKIEIPLPEDAWCQIWLNLVLWFLRRRFFNFVNVFYLLEGKDGTSYKLIWIPFTKGCFVPSLVEIVPLVLEKKMKMWKVYDNNDDSDDSDDDKLTWAFGGYPSSGR